MSVPIERRRYTRVDFNTRTCLKQDDKSFQAELLDISVNGLLVKTPSSYQLDVTRPIEVMIILSEDAIIEMQVALVHTGSEMLGLRCEKIDLDSIAHLRRLVELNIGDEDAAERVLAELLITD